MQEVSSGSLVLGHQVALVSALRAWTEDAWGAQVLPRGAGLRNLSLCPQTHHRGRSGWSAPENLGVAGRSTGAEVQT